MAFKRSGGDGALRPVPGGDSIPLISTKWNNSRLVRRLLFFRYTLTPDLFRLYACQLVQLPPPDDGVILRVQGGHRRLPLIVGRLRCHGLLFQNCAFFFRFPDQSALRFRCENAFSAMIRSWGRGDADCRDSAGTVAAINNGCGVRSCYPSRSYSRIRTVASWARVAVCSRPIVPSPMPRRMPSCVSQRA